METRNKRTKVVVSILALAALVIFSHSGYAGKLEPSGPPGPTMKTLDEVEPRIPVQSLSGSASAVYAIDQPGSYYFTGDVNVVATDKHGIIVEVNDVTIDLMGYGLIGPDSGTGNGIYMNGHSNVEIRNGTVRNFGRDGISEANSGKSHRIIGVRSVSNGRSGIYLLGKNYLVKGCMVNDNGTSATGSSVYGIYAGSGSTVTGNMVYRNGTSAANYVYGICASSGSVVTGNTVNYNGISAASSFYCVYGIFTYSNCTVTGNTVNNNGISAAGSAVKGISAGEGSVVTGNAAYGNGSFASSDVCGIYAYSGSTMTSNAVYENGDSATGNVYGIYARSGNTVTGNTACKNGGWVVGGTVYGIYLQGNNLVDQNTAYNNNTGSGGTNMNNPGNCTFGTNHAP